MDQAKEKRNWTVSDIAGSEVFEADGTRIGVLADVLPTGSNDVWVIKTGSESVPELLLPALASVVLDVDAAHKKIVVALPGGLKEVYAVSPVKPEKKRWKWRRSRE